MDPTKRRALLERNRRRLLRALPPPETILRASIFTRRRRCGGSSCRCAKGKGHPTTYLSASLPGGRTEQISLSPDQVPLARQWVASYRRWWEAVERISAINRELFRRRWASPPRPAGRKKGKA